LSDGLKEKLQAAFLLSGPHSLHDVDLQVTPIDFTALFVFLCFFFLSGKGYHITSNPEWERTCQYEIPFWPK
jgi:hypothetical protein